MTLSFMFTLAISFLDDIVMANSSAAAENSVFSLQEHPFTRRPLEEKKRIKELGPDRPDLNIHQQASDRGRAYNWGFNHSCYDKRSWLAGCAISKAFYCFPCLLFQSVGTEALWTTTGVQDLKHLTEKCKWHESSLTFLGRLSIAEQLDQGCPTFFEPRATFKVASLPRSTSPTREA